MKKNDILQDLKTIMSKIEKLFYINIYRSLAISKVQKDPFIAIVDGKFRKSFRKFQ
jgi:hypothetical protein